jgi:hypothetical protein
MPDHWEKGPTRAQAQKSLCSLACHDIVPSVQYKKKEELQGLTERGGFGGLPQKGIKVGPGDYIPRLPFWAARSDDLTNQKVKNSSDRESNPGVQVVLSVVHMLLRPRSGTGV